MAGEEQGQGQFGADTTNFMAEFGISPSDFALFGGGGSTTTDLPVFVKRKEKPEQVMVGGLPVAGEFEDAAETKLSSEYMKDFMRMNPGDLPGLQRRLWEGGFYNASVDWEDVRQGDYDEATKTAFQRAVDRAAAFYDADEWRTLDEVIDMAGYYIDENGNRVKRGGGAGGGGGGSGRAPLVATVSHPDDIRTAAMKISSQTLGRGWGEEELDRFVATYQSMERAAQSARYAVGKSGGTVQAAPDVRVAAERAARESNPVAAEATDTVNAYDLLVKAMTNLGAR